MRFINKGRGTGKTTMMIHSAYTTGYPIIVTNHIRKDLILQQAHEMNCDDILLILGKGHEDYQIIGTEKHHFSDKEIVLDYIKE